MKKRFRASKNVWLYACLIIAGISTLVGGFIKFGDAGMLRNQWYITLIGISLCMGGVVLIGGENCFIDEQRVTFTPRWIQVRGKDVEFNNVVTLPEIEKARIVSLSKEEILKYTSRRHCPLVNRFIEIKCKYGARKYVHVGWYSITQIYRIVILMNDYAAKSEKISYKQSVQSYGHEHINTTVVAETSDAKKKTKRFIAFYDLLVALFIILLCIVADIMILLAEYVFKIYHGSGVLISMLFTGCIIIAAKIIVDCTQKMYFYWNTETMVACYLFGGEKNSEICFDDVESVEVVKLNAAEKQEQYYTKFLFSKFLKVTLNDGEIKYIYVSHYSNRQIRKITELLLCRQHH